MNTLTPRWLGTPLLLLIMLGGASAVEAYYDPGIQRWLNRDPLGENGFEKRRAAHSYGESADVTDWEPQDVSNTSNLYEYVGNKPNMQIDSYGLFLGFNYGNWCGYSKSGPGLPIDAVDAACFNHDHCLKGWGDTCKFKFCNLKFCWAVAHADCRGNKACKRAKRTILIGCFVIVPIPPFIFM